MFRMSGLPVVLFGLASSAGCSTTPHDQPASYVGVGATPISIRDTEGSIYVRTGGTVQWHKAGGDWEGPVRCATVAGLVTCVMRNPVQGLDVLLEDGTSVRAVALNGTSEWLFIFNTPRSGGDCDYTRWSPVRGVTEIGTVGCSDPEPMHPMWHLSSPVGFFVNDRDPLRNDDIP